MLKAYILLPLRIPRCSFKLGLFIALQLFHSVQRVLEESGCITTSLIILQYYTHKQIISIEYTFSYHYFMYLQNNAELLLT